MSENPSIIACIDAHPKTHSLLRVAANKAAELGVRWAAVYVETPDHYVMDREAREMLLRHAASAEHMGGEFIKLESADVIEALRGYIVETLPSEQPVQHIILGQTTREGFFNELRRSTSEKIHAALRSYPIEIAQVPLSPASYKASWFDRLQLRDIKITDLVIALGSVVIAYGASELLRNNVTHIEWRINSQNVTAFFLIASTVTALRCGLIPGLISAIAGFSVVNYFYTFPVNSFGIKNVTDGISLSIFLISAVLIALLGAYSRASNTALAQKEKRSQALYSIHRLASDAKSREQALEVLHEELTRLLGMQVAFYMPSLASPEKVGLVYPQNITLTERDQKALELCWEEVRRTGLGTITYFNASWRFEPLITPNGEIGVLAFEISEFLQMDASFGRLLGALADQAAAILERIELTRLMSESQINEEREKLRAMLLSSVSHDLKTPLASIIGSLSIYKRMQTAGRLKPEIADELMETALEEAQRLNSFISNILDMTRIESGDVRFDKKWVSVTDMLSGMPKRLRHHLKSSTLEIVEPDPDHEILADQLMTEQMLQNVIENALKYSPAGSTVTVQTRTDKGQFSLLIQDEGAGIPEEKLEAIFDKYERLKMSDSKVAGTGLGLAICKAVMEKQDGEITAHNRPEGGAEFRLTFLEYRRQPVERSELA